MMSNFNYKRIERLNEISNIYRNHLYDACIDYTLKILKKIIILVKFLAIQLYVN